MGIVMGKSWNILQSQPRAGTPLWWGVWRQWPLWWMRPAKQPGRPEFTALAWDCWDVNFKRESLAAGKQRRGEQPDLQFGVFLEDATSEPQEKKHTALWDVDHEGGADGNGSQAGPSCHCLLMVIIISFFASFHHLILKPPNFGFSLITLHCDLPSSRRRFDGERLMCVGVDCSAPRWYARS